MAALSQAALRVQLTFTSQQCIEMLGSVDSKNSMFSIPGPTKHRTQTNLKPVVVIQAAFSFPFMSSDMGGWWNKRLRKTGQSGFFSVLVCWSCCVVTSLLSFTISLLFCYSLPLFFIFPCFVCQLPYLPSNFIDFRLTAQKGFSNSGDGRVKTVRTVAFNILLLFKTKCTSGKWQKKGCRSVTIWMWVWHTSYFDH